MLAHELTLTVACKLMNKGILFSFEMAGLTQTHGVLQKHVGPLPASVGQEYVLLCL